MRQRFFSLSLLGELTKPDIKVTENFAVLMKDTTYSYGTVSERHCYLFTKFGRIIYNCPPTKDASCQQISRTMLQRGICLCLTVLRGPIINTKEWSLITLQKPVKR